MRVPAPALRRLGHRALRTGRRRRSLASPGAYCRIDKWDNSRRRTRGSAPSEEHHVRTGRPTSDRDDRLADFGGYVPDRSKADVDYTGENYAEFLVRYEPKGPRKPLRPGELTEHGFRMRLLDRERERREEQAAGKRRK